MVPLAFHFPRNIIQNTDMRFSKDKDIKLIHYKCTFYDYMNECNKSIYIFFYRLTIFFSTFSPAVFLCYPLHGIEYLLYI